MSYQTIGAATRRGIRVSQRPQVLLFTIDAGGGHRAAARALAAAAEETSPGFELRVESFQQVLLPLDLLRRLSGLSLEDAYNLILRQHWNSFMVPLLRVMHGAIALRRRAVVRTLAAWLRAQPRPAAVVSVFPNFNGILRDALAEAHPGVPLVVVLTDFADFPPRFWIEPGIDRVIVASDEAERQAAALGVARRSVSRVSGMVLHPRFYRSAQAHPREAVRAELGLRARGLRADAALRRQGLTGDGAAGAAAARRRPGAARARHLRRQPAPAREAVDDREPRRRAAC